MECGGLEEIITTGNVNVATISRVSDYNAKARGDQLKNSGFSFTVQDIKKPEWRFQTVDEAVCKRWNEILTQMNEGQLATR